MFARPKCDNVLQPNPEVVRAATHWHRRAWQMLIPLKECYIVIVTYLLKPP